MAPGTPGASGSGAALPGWGRGLGNSTLGRKGQGKINRERLRDTGHRTGHEDGTRGQHAGSTTRSTEPAMHAGKFPRGAGDSHGSQSHGSPRTQSQGFSPSSPVELEWERLFPGSHCCPSLGGPSSSGRDSRTSGSHRDILESLLGEEEGIPGSRFSCCSLR